MRLDLVISFLLRLPFRRDRLTDSATRICLLTSDLISVLSAHTFADELKCDDRLFRAGDVDDRVPEELHELLH